MYFILKNCAGQWSALAVRFLHFLCLTCGNRGARFGRFISMRSELRQFRVLPQKNRYSARGTLLFSSQSFIVQKIHHCTTNVELTLLPARA